jgi:site-specific recombinase XerD
LRAFGGEQDQHAKRVAVTGDGRVARVALLGHLVRHSLATQLVRQRRPINEVADLLGHRSIDTTAIYVKVAVPQLADIALPFPGGVS